MSDFSFEDREESTMQARYQKFLDEMAPKVPGTFTAFLAGHAMAWEEAADRMDTIVQELIDLENDPE